MGRSQEVASAQSLGHFYTEAWTGSTSLFITQLYHLPQGHRPCQVGKPLVRLYADGRHPRLRSDPIIVSCSPTVDGCHLRTARVLPTLMLLHYKQIPCPDPQRKADLLCFPPSHLIYLSSFPFPHSILLPVIF